MKFETHARDINVNRKITKSEVTPEIQDGHHRHLEFHIIVCHFIDNCPILTKFCTEMQEKISQTKSLKLDVDS